MVPERVSGGLLKASVRGALALSAEITIVCGSGLEGGSIVFGFVGAGEGGSVFFTLELGPCSGKAATAEAGEKTLAACMLEGVERAPTGSMDVCGGKEDGFDGTGAAVVWVKGKAGDVGLVDEETDVKAYGGSARP